MEQKQQDMELKSAAELYRKDMAEKQTNLDFSHEHKHSKGRTKS